MARYFSSQLTKTAYNHLYYSTHEGFSQPFFAYEIGPLCNGARSFSFSQATGDLQVILAVEEGVKKDAPRAFNFGNLYRKGFDLMRNLFAAAILFEDFDEPSRRALQTLLDFIKNKEYNEKCLAKVLKKDKDVSETDIAVALSEHFLAKLSPGKSYFMDKRSKGKGDCKCKCGCTAEIEYEPSGFGNKHVWHGFLDVVFRGHGEVKDFETAAQAIKRPRLDAEDEASEDIDESEHSDELDSSPGGKNGVEVKRDLNDTIENQAAAQAIVFSITQKERHPDLDNFLIPFLAISASGVRIFMYDAENDILLRSQELSIFRKGEDILTFNFDTVIILWMVLHYKYFCSGIDQHLSVSLNNMKSGFLELAEKKDCMQHYKASESGCDYFPPVPKERKLIGRRADEWAPCGWPGAFVSDCVYFADESSDTVEEVDDMTDETNDI